jgi:hypothetical protein
MRLYLAAAAAVGACLVAQPTMATVISDPTGDFIASYAGPHLADLDVVNFSANLQGANFLLSATMAGNIGTSDGFYVIGVDRGGSPAPFAALGKSGVLFNAVILLQQDATGVVNLMPATTSLAPGAVSISGSTISAIIPMALLPSTGFSPLQYGFNIWPRTTAVTGNPAISDFAPNNSTITAVPEPKTWAILLLGFGSVGAALRFRRKGDGRLQGSGKRVLVRSRVPSLT